MASDEFGSKISTEAPVNPRLAAYHRTQGARMVRPHDTRMPAIESALAQEPEDGEYEDVRDGPWAYRFYPDGSIKITAAPTQDPVTGRDHTHMIGKKLSRETDAYRAVDKLSPYNATAAKAVSKAAEAEAPVQESLQGEAVDRYGESDLYGESEQPLPAPPRDGRSPGLQALEREQALRDRAYSSESAARRAEARQAAAGRKGVTYGALDDAPHRAAEIARGTAGSLYDLQASGSLTGPHAEQRHRAAAALRGDLAAESERSNQAAIEDWQEKFGAVREGAGSLLAAIRRAREGR